jgi:hypothetical protein
MRFFLTLFLAVVLVFFGVQVYRLHVQKQDLLVRDTELSGEASIIAIENRRFAGDIEYLKNDRNLTKELQSKFNYRKPEEKMFMLAPAKEDGR